MHATKGQLSAGRRNCLFLLYSADIKRRFAEKSAIFLAITATAAVRGSDIIDGAQHPANGVTNGLSTDARAVGSSVPTGVLRTLGA